MENSEEKNIDVKDTMQDRAYKVIKKCKEIAEKDFTKFSALFVAVMTVGLWVIKGMWYAYQTGRFSVYGIDSCYISSDNESILLQIIQMTAVLVVLFSINYIYYKISVSEDKSKFHWRRKLRLLGYWLTEMFLLFILVLITSGINIIDLIKDCEFLTYYEDGVAYRGKASEMYMPTQNLLRYFASKPTTRFIDLQGYKEMVGKEREKYLTSFLIEFVVNIYGIEFAIEKKLSSRKRKKLESKAEKKKDIEEENQHKRNGKNMIFAVFITVAVEMLLMYIFGIVLENDRASYKLVLVEQETSEDSQYIFQYQSGQMNYTICPIVFENSDYYILTRIYKRDGKIEIDYEYQKIIGKTDIETFNCENIYEINIGE